MILLTQAYEPFYYFLIAAFAFFLVFLSIPSTIHVANERHLFDSNDLERKNHHSGISRLGGIALFSSFIISRLLFGDFFNFPISNYLLTAYIMLFAVGLKDDLWGVNPSTKFFIQLLVGLIVVFLGDVRLTSMYGVFGIYQLPYEISASLSVLIIIFITNAFNLIDGIDGLVGITSALVSFSFGLLFIYIQQPGYASVAFTLTGGVVGFLWYNVSPAKIFMGDAGSLFIGLICSVLSIKFIELNHDSAGREIFIQSAPAIAVAVLIGPVFDAIRVFVLRLVKGGSPFIADNNHIHHRIVKLGLSHIQTSLVLMSFNLFIVFFVINLRDQGNMLLFSLLLVICIVFNILLTLLVNYKERKAFNTRKPAELAKSF